MIRMFWIDIYTYTQRERERERDARSDSYFQRELGVVLEIEANRLSTGEI